MQQNKKFGFPARALRGILPPMVNKPSPASNHPIPVRLRILRKAEGYDTARAFADFLGISPARYGNIEAGHPLSIEVAQLIVSKVSGMSLDWLYNNVDLALPHSLRQRLMAAASDVTGNVRTTSSRTTRKVSPRGKAPR
jgi:transcriptional regulator with XRE-family HTH domain